MIALSYYEPLQEKDEAERDLTNVWLQTWRRHGLFPAVLNESWAKRHPAYAQMKRQAAQLPTVNDQRYEEQCYLRWCAYAVWTKELDIPQKVVAMDYDILPNWSYEGIPSKIGFANFDPEGGCSCLAGWHKNYESIVGLLLGYKNDVKAFHVSDMLIVKQADDALLFDTRLAWLAVYRDPYWENKPLIHFANRSIRANETKIGEVRKVLKL